MGHLRQFKSHSGQETSRSRRRRRHPLRFDFRLLLRRTRRVVFPVAIWRTSRLHVHHGQFTTKQNNMNFFLILEVKYRVIYYGYSCLYLSLSINLN